MGMDLHDRRALTAAGAYLTPPPGGKKGGGGQKWKMQKRRYTPEDRLSAFESQTTNWPPDEAADAHYTYLLCGIFGILLVAA